MNPVEIVERFARAAESANGSALSQFLMEGDLIKRYWEVFDSGMALAQLDFAPERIRKVLSRANDAFLRTVPTDH